MSITTVIFEAQYIIPLVVSLFFSLLIVATQQFHGALTLDGAVGVQKFHRRPTPRVGGVALAAGMAAAIPALGSAPSALLALVLLAGVPAFAAGLIEDVTKKVGPSARLAATLISGVLLVLITGAGMDRGGIWLVDDVLKFWPASLVVTAVAVGAAANAVNIVDGFHGLAAGVLIIGASAFGFIARDVGDVAMMELCFVLAASVAGFVAINFPWGRIFLGDAGAYFGGYLLAAMGLLIVSRNPEVSPWAVFLVLGYPAIEMLFSVWRKTIRDGHHPSQPDAVHFHMLVRRSVGRRVARTIGFPNAENAMTAVVIWPLPALCALLALLSGYRTLPCMAGFLVVLLIYLACYRKLSLRPAIPLLRRASTPFSAPPPSRAVAKRQVVS